jgi:hypothetical protein
MAEYEEEQDRTAEEQAERERELIAAYETVFLCPEGDIVIDDLRRALDVFGSDSDIYDETLAEIPHPYRAYVELGLQKAWRRISAMYEYVKTERTREVADAADEA